MPRSIMQIQLLPLRFLYQHASGKTVTVNYATSDGTATAGADYTAISATTLTFAAGQTSKTFNVTILNDLSYESSETCNCDSI